MRMPTKSEWAFVNGFAGWLSGIGTLLAVIVSLYLARRDSRIRLRVSVGIRRLFMMGQAPREGTDYIVISVTNVGRRVATVTGLLWKNRLVRRRYLYQVLGTIPLSAQVPKRLQDGEDAAFTIPLTAFIKNDPRDFKRVIPRPRILSVLFLTLQVSTSAGPVFRAHAESELRKWLLEFLEGQARETI